MKRKELTTHTQQAAHLLHNKPTAFAQRTSHLLHNKPIALTKRGCCSAPGAPALSPGPCTARAAAAERRERLAEPVSAKERERECTDDIW